MKTEYDILLAPPDIGETEKKAVLDCLEKNWISTTGPYSGILGKEVSALLGKKYSLATNSGTSALELALIGLGVGKGDHVALPSWSFSADPNAIIAIGGVPVFVDINDRLGLCPKKLEECIVSQIRKNEPIKAILAVHPPNGAFDVLEIKRIAQAHKLPVLEDAAGSLFSTANGMHLGSLTEVGCVSFNGNKIITGGSGGLVITNSKKLHERCEAHAVNSQTSAYIANVAGSNRLMVNVCASIALAQFARRTELLNLKKKIFTTYRADISSLAFFSFPLNDDPEFCSNNWMYYILLNDGIKGNEMVRFFEQHRVQVRTFWRSLPDERAYRQFPCYGKTVAQRVAKRMLCLPCGTTLTAKQQSKVVSLLHDYSKIYV